MQFLSWNKVSASHHELRALDGTLWAEVKPYTGTDEFPARPGMMQAFARLSDFQVGGNDFWLLGASVPNAKGIIQNWMGRNRCAAENFTIVDVRNQRAQADLYERELSALLDRQSASSASLAA